MVAGQPLVLQQYNAAFSTLLRSMELPKSVRDPEGGCVRDPRRTDSGGGGAYHMKCCEDSEGVAAPWPCHRGALPLFQKGFKRTRRAHLQVWLGSAAQAASRSLRWWRRTLRACATSPCRRWHRHQQRSMAMPMAHKRAVRLWLRIPTRCPCRQAPSVMLAKQPIISLRAVHRHLSRCISSEVQIIRGAYQRPP